MIPDRVIFNLMTFGYLELTYCMSQNPKTWHIQIGFKEGLLKGINHTNEIFKESTAI